MNTQLLIAAALLGVMPPAPVHAQRAPKAADEARALTYLRETVDAIEGLPDSHITSLAQTPDGYLWLGTRRGLVRFDGLSATLYSPQNTPALPAPTINALSVDALGRLWISTDRGLAVREGQSVRRIAPRYVPDGTVWEVLHDQRGRIWVAGDFGLRVGDGTTFRDVAGVDAHVYALGEDRLGRIWMAGRGILASLGEGEAVPVRWPVVNDARVYDLAISPAGTVWIALRDGIRELDVANPHAIVERARIGTALGRNRAQVWSIALDGRGHVWLGTDTRGVLRWDGTTLHNDEIPAGSTVDPVWWVMRDQRGLMWAATSGGLVRYRRSAFERVTEGLTVPNVWSIRGAADGSIWAATDEGQVWWRRTGAWTPVFTGLANRVAPALWPSRDGSMLIADDDGKIWRGTPEQLTDVTANYAFPAEGPLGMFEEADGSVIATTHHGVLRSRGGRITPLFDSLQLTKDDEPRVILRDADGRLVVGGPFLTILRGTTAQRLGVAAGLSDSAVLAVHSTARSLWIGTADSGLFVQRGARVVALAAYNPKLQRGINGITSDGTGSLWMTSHTGLLRASIRELEQAADGAATFVPVREFDRADGLPTSDINSDYQSQLHHDRSGRIWLPTYAGPVVFDPAAIVDDSIPPNVLIQDIVIDGVTYENASAITVPQHPSRVEIRFAATNALVPRRVRAEYRIGGLDTSWIALGRRRTLSFGPLVGGEYRVEIRVAGEDGAWNPARASLVLHVPFLWRERVWFYPVLALVGAVCAFGVARVRLRAAQRREQFLAHQVRERTADLEASRSQLEVRVAERTEALSRELAERTRLEQRLAGTRRLASLGRLAGGVSHEINNALATVLGFAQLAQLSARHDERVQADLGEVVRAGRRAANITHQLLAFARQHHTALRPVQLADIVHGNVRSLGQLAAGLTIDVRVADHIPVVGADTAQIEQLLANLIKNARDAKPVDQRIVVALDACTLEVARAVGDRVVPAGDYAVLSVSDRGVGIPAESLEQLFEPFFTTKEVNEGTGLGLAVVQGIVARHHGAIEVHSVVNEGTTFRIWLPLWAGGDPVDTAVDVDTEGGHETILLVEDDASIRQFATRMLTDAGYRVLDAEDGAAALTLVGQSIDSIDLVVTDVLMPNVNGLELIRLLRAARPDVPCVFMTGYAGLDDAALDELRASGPVLAKPFTHDDLLLQVRRVLHAATRSAAAEHHG